MTIRNYRCFNSRTPRGVRRPPPTAPSAPAKFQFTHPAWGATRQPTLHLTRRSRFNSRTPRGVRRHVFLCFCVSDTVSIHAPRVGCDSGKTKGHFVIFWFHFTHPAWGATSGSTGVACVNTVSIHAPRVGCDIYALLQRSRERLFQFTHPAWGATFVPKRLVWDGWFQFTHPAWGATS